MKVRDFVFWPLLIASGWINAAEWPLRISASGHYLEDQAGVPFLIHLDSAWEPCVALTTNEVISYLDNRSAKGFNTLLLNLIDDQYFGHDNHYGSPSNNKNRYNESPFTIQDDFTAMNEAYWLFVDFVLQAASDRGMLIAANPCYVGKSDGFRSEMVNAGVVDMSDYGRFIGKRYSHLNNILWIAGGDDYLDAGEDATAVTEAIITGVGEFHAGLWTAHLNSRLKTSCRDVAGSWLGVDAIYPSRTNAYFCAIAAYRKNPPMPVFMIEQRYENDDWGPPDGISPLRTIRRQAWYSILGGCAGASFGNHPCWGFYADWENNLDTIGNQQYGHMIRFFQNRRWHLLEPDDNHEVLTSGYGTFTDDLAIADYVACARANDGSWAAAYLPVGDEVTIAQSQLNAPYRASWFNPRDGSTSNIGTYTNSGSRVFNAPDNNDWVLVLDAQVIPEPPTNLRIVQTNAVETASNR